MCGLFSGFSGFAKFEASIDQHGSILPHFQQLFNFTNLIIDFLKRNPTDNLKTIMTNGLDQIINALSLQKQDKASFRD